LTAQLTDLEDQLRDQALDRQQARDACTQSDELRIANEKLHRDVAERRQAEDDFRQRVDELQDQVEHTDQQAKKMKPANKRLQEDMTQFLQSKGDDWNQTNQTEQNQAIVRERIEQIEREIEELNEVKMQVREETSELKKKLNLKDRKAPLNPEEASKLARLFSQHSHTINAINALDRERSRLEENTMEPGAVSPAANEEPVEALAAD
jgi:chromosome segregation ATPase